MNKATSYTDLVFEHKNTAYGAYQLRKKHMVFTFIGFAISCFIIFGGFGVSFWLKAKNAAQKEGTLKVQHKKVIAYTQLTAPPPIETIDNQPKTRTNIEVTQPRAVKKFLPPVVKKDEEVLEEELIPTQQELKKVNIGSKNIDGDTTGNVFNYDMGDVEIIFDEASKGSKIENKDTDKTNLTVKNQEAVKEEEIYGFVQKKPEFPGGESAMLSFIYANISYPKIARENGIMGMVVIRFVVEKDGLITNMEALKDIGGGCAEEAMRVIRTMPKWNPGEQNGNSVRVSFVLPVKFELTN